MCGAMCDTVVILKKDPNCGFNVGGGYELTSSPTLRLPKRLPAFDDKYDKCNMLARRKLEVSGLPSLSPSLTWVVLVDVVAPTKLPCPLAL